MRTITTRELRRTLANVLAGVENGEEVHVTRRGRVIAKLTPAGSPSAAVPQAQPALPPEPAAPPSQPPQPQEPKMPRFETSIKKLFGDE